MSTKHLYNKYFSFFHIHEPNIENSHFSFEKENQFRIKFLSNINKNFFFSFYLQNISGRLTDTNRISFLKITIWQLNHKFNKRKRLILYIEL